MIILRNVAHPTDGIRLIQGQVSVFFENDGMGEGELTVAENAVTWISSRNGQGFSLTYPSISLHAVARDQSVFPDDCLYVLVDASKADLELERNEVSNGGQNESESDEDEGDARSLAIRFVPQDKSILNNIYQQMCECQALHPDENDDNSSEEGYYGNYEEEYEGADDEGSEMVDDNEILQAQGDYPRSAGSALMPKINPERGDADDNDRMEEG